jgi:phosphocarrier protein
MKDARFTVTAEDGIHARPAAMIVELAQKFSSSITIRTPDLTINAKSIMDIMMLSAVSGTEFTLRIEGDDEDQAMDEMITLLK